MASVSCRSQVAANATTASSTAGGHCPILPDELIKEAPPEQTTLRELSRSNANSDWDSSCGLLSSGPVYSGGRPIEYGLTTRGRVSTDEVDTLWKLQSGVSSSFDDSAAADSSASDFRHSPA
jgi:hypothetical protein